MIGYLKGRIVERSEDHLIVEAGGVGYELHCSLNSLAEVEGRDEAEFWVQTQMREDSLSLYGFTTMLEKRMFNSLLKANGVGPKMAIKILSAARIPDLARMIETGDVKALSGLPKVGKKTAEQLVLTLKGKLGLEPTTAKPMHQAKTESRYTGTRAEILSALVNLGFRLQEVERVVAGFPDDIGVERGVRDGLKALAGAF